MNSARKLNLYAGSDTGTNSWTRKSHATACARTCNCPWAKEPWPTERCTAAIGSCLARYPAGKAMPVASPRSSGTTTPVAFSLRRFSVATCCSATGSPRIRRGTTCRGSRRTTYSLAGAYPAGCERFRERFENPQRACPLATAAFNIDLPNTPKSGGAAKLAMQRRRNVESAKRAGRRSTFVTGTPT